MPGIYRHFRTGPISCRPGLWLAFWDRGRLIEDAATGVHRGIASAAAWPLAARASGRPHRGLLSAHKSSHQKYVS
jgi:hypothetical protein